MNTFLKLHCQENMEHLFLHNDVRSIAEPAKIVQRLYIQLNIDRCNAINLFLKLFSAGELKFQGEAYFGIIGDRYYETIFVSHFYV